MAKKLQRFKQIVEKGGTEKDILLLKAIDTIEETLESLSKKVEKIDPTFSSIMEQVKGKDAKPEDVADALLNDKVFLNKVRGEDGNDYVLTDEDKKDIASKIEVPIVEKVVEKTEVVKVQTVKEEKIVEKIEKDLPQLGEAIRDGLELIVEEDEKLEIEAIGHLREELNKLKKLFDSIDKKVVYIGGQQSGGRIVRSYDLSPELDGSTKTFNLPALWRVISVHSTSFPFSFRETVDFTWTPQSITFTDEITAGTTLAEGQTITIVYSEA